MDGFVGFIQRLGPEFRHIMLESGVWLIVGLAFAGLIHAFVPRAWFIKHLSGRGVAPIAKASLLGIPMPLCSCSVIPVAAGLRREGAGKGASAAFAISTPQTGEESIPITWALFGPVFALARPVIAVVTGFLAGYLIEKTGKPEPEQPDFENESVASLSVVGRSAPEPAKSCCSTEAPAASESFGAKLQTVLQHGFVTMLRDLAPWLAVGLILAAVIGAALPQGWIAENIGTGVWPKVAMLFVGVPLYICATSSTPLAWSLVVAGLSPGTAIVLLLAGPATNVATMGWVIKDLGGRALVVYLGVIGAVALVSGVLFDAFFAEFVTLATRGAAHEHAGIWGAVKAVCAATFVGLLVWALIARYWPSKEPQSCCASTGRTGCGCKESA